MAGITQNYWETLDPYSGAAETAVTLAATNKALIPAARYSQLGTQFFNKVGRKIRMRAFGSITTGATPGNLTIGVLFGTGADANGVSVAFSGALALTASQTNIPFELEIFVKCLSTGAAGTLFCGGIFRAGAAVMATGVNMIPATAPGASGAVDLTGTLIPSIQAARSGSTAETIQVFDYGLVPTN